MSDRDDETTSQPEPVSDTEDEQSGTEMEEEEKVLGTGHDFREYVSIFTAQMTEKESDVRTTPLRKTPPEPESS
jgi:hypothetical protein